MYFICLTQLGDPCNLCISKTNFATQRVCPTVNPFVSHHWKIISIFTTQNKSYRFFSSILVIDFIRSSLLIFAILKSYQLT